MQQQPQRIRIADREGDSDAEDTAELCWQRLIDLVGPMPELPPKIKIFFSFSLCTIDFADRALLRVYIDSPMLF